MSAPEMSVGSRNAGHGRLVKILVWGLCSLPLLKAGLWVARPHLAKIPGLGAWANKHLVAKEAAPGLYIETGTSGDVQFEKQLVGVVREVEAIFGQKLAWPVKVKLITPEEWGVQSEDQVRFEMWSGAYQPKLSKRYQMHIMLVKQNAHGLRVFKHELCHAHVSQLTAELSGIRNEGLANFFELPVDQPDLYWRWGLEQVWEDILAHPETYNWSADENRDAANDLEIRLARTSRMRALGWALAVYLHEQGWSAQKMALASEGDLPPPAEVIDFVRKKIAAPVEPPLGSALN